MCAHRREERLEQSRHEDAAGVAGGFRRVLRPLRGGGDGITQAGGTKYKVLAHAYMYSESVSTLEMLHYNIGTSISECLYYRKSIKVTI